MSRVERGAVNLRLSDAERLFASAGVRLVVRTARPTEDEAPDPDLIPRAEAADELTSLLNGLSYVFRQFRVVPYVIGGRVAALAQGMPVRPVRIDIHIRTADVEGARSALRMCSTLRWSDRHQEFRGYDTDVARPGERRWLIAGLIELAIDVAEDLPAALTVAAADTQLAVVPLVVLLAEDPDIAELAVRLAG